MFVFFFKQKTAYEMRISDWSSDVCSSDLFDIGGSMDDHIRVTEELFSAARAEFKHMEFFYFHNCVYEKLWKDNRRRHSDFTPTHEVLRTYQNDYKIIFVGDATMSPYEIVQPGGSVEHWNEEAGAVWRQIGRASCRERGGRDG